MTDDSRAHRADILVVDDEAEVREFCREALLDLGFAVRTASSAEEALQFLTDFPVDIVLTDLMMPRTTGIELLERIKERAPAVDVVLMTGHATIETAVRAMQLGASDYVSKPLSVADLGARLDRLTGWRDLVAENQLLREQVRSQSGAYGMVGTSQRMQEVYRTVLLYARKRQPVLILGESGSGKELVARAIHDFGESVGEPFVPIDCSALSPHLVESELFGHARGAFTGAVQDRLGLLAAAKRGTAFLDEIGELPLDLQAKLLRALQERELRPVGSNRAVPFEARIVAATNRDLLAASREGKFRSDLYYRLNVLRIELPPLRERKADIPALVQAFLARHSSPDEGIVGVAPEAMDRLMRHSWPGNVRELENAIQRALAMSSGPWLKLADFPPEIRHAVPGGHERQYTYLEQIERTAILETLDRAGGQRQRAAQMLGIGKTTLYRKLKDYGIDCAEEPEPARVEPA